MDTHREGSRPQARPGTPGFARVVCGIDGSREGFEAVRQAARLTAPGGRLVLVAVADYFAALSGRWGSEPARRWFAAAAERSLDDRLSEMRDRAGASLALAERQADGPVKISKRLVDGDVDIRLLEAVDAESATLLVVGTHGGSRIGGAVIGEATSMVLHEASASVLVARLPFDPEHFPATIVVGLDGSPGSREALDAAAQLREISGGSLTVLTAGGDADEATGALGDFAPFHERVISEHRPVDALVDAARTADLVVVGSRGLHGARALGSVSERVAHRASSSVLVVRPCEGRAA